MILKITIGGGISKFLSGWCKMDGAVSRIPRSVRALDCSFATRLCLQSGALSLAGLEPNRGLAHRRFRSRLTSATSPPLSPGWRPRSRCQDATISAIVEAADAPLSIVIVGVGLGDFTAMERLDGDRQRLADPFTGREAARDMVQFVPFREFNGFGAAAQHALAKHVLAEIPGQFIAYMETNGIPPAARRPGVGAMPVASKSDVPSSGGYAGGYSESLPGAPLATGTAAYGSPDDQPPPYPM